MLRRWIGSGRGMDTAGASGLCGRVASIIALEMEMPIAATSTKSTDDIMRTIISIESGR